MKMAKNRLKTGPPQQSLNTNATPLVLFSSRLFAAKLQYFESLVNDKFLSFKFNPLEPKHFFLNF